MRFMELQLSEAAYDSKIATMKKKYPEYASEIDWAKPNLKRQDRVFWYLGQLEKLFKDETNEYDPKIDIETIQDVLMHFLGQENIQTIQNYVFTDKPYDDLFDELRNLERKYHAGKQSKGRYDPDLGDETLLQFKDGTSWVKLNTAYCEKEGKSGSHCGNVAGRADDTERILSYRTPDDRVILTFILDHYGNLGEMKGRFNKKPEEKYHDAIIALLLQPYINGIRGGGYLSEQNFSLTDLRPDKLRYVYDKKPQLFVGQIKANPLIMLTMPDYIRKNEDLQGIAITHATGPYKNYLGKLLQNPKDFDTWQEVINMYPNWIFYAPKDFPRYKEYLLYYFSSSSARTQNFQLIPAKYRKDFEFLSELAKVAPAITLLSIPTTDKNYEKLTTLAIEYCNKNILSRVVKYIPEEKFTEEMAKAAIKRSINVISVLPNHVLTEEICIYAVSHGPESKIYSLPTDKITYNVALASIKNSGNTINFINRIVSYKDPANKAPISDYELVKLCNEYIDLYGGEQLLYMLDTQEVLYEIYLNAVKDEKKAINFVPPQLRNYVLTDLGLMESLGNIKKLCGLLS